MSEKSNSGLEFYKSEFFGPSWHCHFHYDFNFAFYPIYLMSAQARRDAHRQRLLQALYNLDNRQSPTHPYHATYSGLAQSLPVPAQIALNLLRLH